MRLFVLDVLVANHGFECRSQAELFDLARNSSMRPAGDDSQTITSLSKFAYRRVRAIDQFRRLLAIVLEPQLIRRLPIILRQVQSFVHCIPVRRVASIVKIPGETDPEVGEGFLECYKSGARGVEQGSIPIKQQGRYRTCSLHLAYIVPGAC